jgi:2-polyprenyl-3-methyl-5-hydroxy-6-metoxy-1,4-benzoquinol methylase
VLVELPVDTQAAIYSILEAYYRDTLGLSDWKNAVNKRLNTKLDAQLQRLAAFVELTDKRVLDVGCGFGDMMVGLLQAGAAEVMGIDPDGTWVNIAAVRGQSHHRRYRVNQAVGEQLPFRSNTFDLVFSNFVVEHVNNLQLVINEMIRVLKPGGQCVINCPNYLWPFEPHYRLPWIPYLPKTVGKYLLARLGRNPDYFFYHIHYVTPLDVLNALRQVGITQTINLFQLSLTRPELIMTPLLRQWATRLRGIYLPSMFIYLLLPSASILATKSVS